MSIEFEFAPVDVDLLFHPKAMAAGVEAMGLWTWSVLWSQKVGADGKLPKHVLVSAWGGSKAVTDRLAKRLVAAGLWIATEEGWEIWNYLRKNQSAADKEKKRAQGRARMQRLRSKGKNSDASVTVGDASRDAHVHDQHAAPSPAPSPEAEDHLQEAERDRADGDAPPTWWTGAVAAAAMAVGPIDRPEARWLEYDAARARKGWAKNHRDAVGWLTSVRRSEITRDSDRPKSFVRGKVPSEITKQPVDENVAWMKAGELERIA